jgi:hypothetical protein
MTQLLSSLSPLVMEEVNDPAELVEAYAQDARAQLNSDWLQAHIQEIYTQHRGKVIVVAGQQLFVADTPEAALALARAAHPDDHGSLIRYIPERKVAWVYAH